MDSLEYWKLNPYLPYRPILKCKLGEGELQKNQFCTWIGVKIDPEEPFEFFVRGLDHVKTVFPIENVTPLLYPIESISINRHREYGYNFNPMKELFRKIFDLEDRDNSHITSNVTYLGEDILINVEYNRTFLRIEISEGLFKLIPTKKSKIVTFDSVKIDSFLIRHHFDIYGMVYNGIAGNKDYYSKNIKELCG